MSSTVVVSNTVVVSTQGGPFPGVDPRVSKRRALKMLRHLELDDVELSIALVSDDVMRELNHNFRGKDRPTDVLAFAMVETLGEAPPDACLDGALHVPDDGVLGDVVISIDTARTQARQQGRSLLDETTMLLAHGLLHLLGYDHDTKAKDRVMRTKTSELEAAARARLK